MVDELIKPWKQTRNKNAIEDKTIFMVKSNSFMFFNFSHFTFFDILLSFGIKAPKILNTKSSEGDFKKEKKKSSTIRT